MRDLDIWRRLVARRATADDVDALATLPLGRRVAFIGLVVPLTSHDDPALRAAALRALARARGTQAVRAIVARLGDDVAEVRAAALHALREVARDAPYRFVHALYHPRVDVRRAALASELPVRVAELAIYLRADREVADLVHEARWPEGSFPLALELYADGHLPARELIERFARTPGAFIQAFVARALARPHDALEDYLERGGSEPPRGRDVLDTLVAAIAEAGAPPRAVAQLVDIATPKHARSRQLARRAAVALLAQLARAPSASLWAACVALEPRVLAHARFAPAYTAAAAEGLFQYRWPVRPSEAQVHRLLALPAVQGDLALAAAVAGLFPSKRLHGLAAALGEDRVVAALIASDHGWDEICRLPPETPPREIAWLARVEKADEQRFVALAGRALGSFDGTRLERFVEQLPRRHRASVYSAAIAAYRASSDARVTAIASVIAARAERATFVALVKQLLAPTGVAPAAEDERMVLALARAAPPKLVAGTVAELDDRALARLIALVDADPLPRDRELALAAALASRTLPEVVAWRARVASQPTATTVRRPSPRSHRALSPAEHDQIASCADRDLERALEPVFAGHITGVVAALSERPEGPSVAACNALFGCADPLADVARVLDRFSAPTLEFEGKLDDAATRWLGQPELPVLARARLWRWEACSFALVDWMESLGGACDVLRVVDDLPGRLARHTLWKAIAEALLLLRYRARERFASHATGELARFCAERVDRDIGRHAARILVTLVEARQVALSEIRDAVLDRVADADRDARDHVARLVRLDGIPEPTRTTEPLSPALLERVRACTELDELAAWCRDPRPAIVQEAALALVVLGAPGQTRLAELLAHPRELPSPTPIFETIQLWDHPPAIDAVRALARSADLPPAWQFHVSLALLARGERDALAPALAAVRAPAADWQFRREDWDALVRVADVVTCAIALADSPHHHAYQRALQILLSLTRPTDEVRAALLRFLEQGNHRPLHLRVSAARYLAQHWKDATGLPILAEYIADERADDWPYTLELVPRADMAAVADMIVSAALVGGPLACSEKRMWAVVQRMRDCGFLDAETQAAIDLRIFEHASQSATRAAAARYAVSEATSHARLRRVAEVFAWGIRRGVELTGRLFSIHMTAKERDLGHTKLDGSHLFVSPLPMLREEPHGQDIVEGLVLHELGHHLYHRSEDAQKLWKRAHDEGVGHLLNLIADEHLERNLRALDSSYGDRLKRLGAYAFQHAPQEIRIAALFEALRAATARAFTAAGLEVAYDEEAVRVRRGAILAELDRAGHPVARFARALRMGLGNRARDPLVERALALCGKDLRTLDMRGLYDLTWRLVELFGGKHEIATVFGGPEGLAFGDRDEDVFGAGIDDDILQREVERVLDPRRSRRGPASAGPARLVLNVDPDTRFDRITRIVRVRGDAETHRKLAAHVQRHATRLRAFLDELGLRWEPQRARTQGRALDRTRLTALVTRNDPRILVARTPVRRTDLFVGTLVDCSSSMKAGENIERAKRFAVLVAEAVRALPGVEARFFGFTDSVIYDAGSATDCGVVSLSTSGGNNDAAALYHAANVALNSKRRAKLLVMISDGLPTECSVAALRSLVTELTRRRGIVCAQVALRRLEEVCFPHHVLLDDHELDVAVAQFGRMIGDLARRSLSS